jgi:hypothetical protein
MTDDILFRLALFVISLCIVAGICIYIFKVGDRVRRRELDAHFDPHGDFPNVPHMRKPSRG